MQPIHLTRLLVTVATCVATFQAVAQTVVQAPPNQMHEWQAAQPRLTPEAYFTNLKDGAKIETPFRLTFGLSGGWGLAPIAQSIDGKSGHHHLLVNRALPLNFKQALPATDQYIHFGKGQMETVLTLEPGEYTLRLLLADGKHIPHFVYSEPLKITVTAKRTDVDPKSLVKKSISILNPGMGAEVRAPFRMQFHASGLSVGHLNQKLKDSGHFRLTLAPQGGGKPAVMDFPNGQTEAWLAPPPGKYTAQLALLDNTDTRKTLAVAANLDFQVDAR